MEPKKQTPSIGRVVHLVYGNEHVPALIIDPAFMQDEEEVQGLQVFTMDDGAFTMVAKYDPNCAGGTWHWPEYIA